MSILFVVAMHLAIQALNVANLQACHSVKQWKQIFQINVKWLKIQIIWLFTKRDRGFELGTTEKQVAGWRP